MVEVGVTEEGIIEKGAKHNAEWRYVSLQLLLQLLQELGAGEPKQRRFLRSILLPTRHYTMERPDTRPDHTTKK